MKLTIFFWLAVGVLNNPMRGAAQQVVQEKIFVHTDRNYYQTGEIIWFRVYCIDAEKQRPSLLSKLAYAEVLDSANRPVLQTKIRVDSGAAHGSIVIPSSVPTGVYVFRCYTNWMKNFGVDTFFDTELAIVNAANGSRAFLAQNSQLKDAGGLKLAVKPRQQQYGKREKIIVDISASNATGSNVAADVSISVYKLDSLIRPDNNVISASLGTPLVEVPDSFPFAPEYMGHMVYGRVLSRNTRLPSKNIAGYLTVMNDANSFYNGTTDNRGHIQFLVTELNAADSIVVQTHSYYHPDQQVELESPFFNQYSTAKASRFSSTENFPSTVLRQSINAQATALYYEEEINRFEAERKDSIPFYYKSDAQYELDDFTRFSKIEDIFREYIRPVGVTKRQGNFHLTVFNQSNRYINDQQPLVLVDGLPVFNTNTLFAYDPLKVKTIDIVTNRYFRSGSVFQGIINMRTYRGRTDGELVDPNATVLGYEIVQRQRAFFSPSYNGQGDEHIPDLRTTLYWNPSVLTTASGKATIEFYTGDLNGEYIISVQGIGPRVSGSAQHFISVK